MASRVLSGARAVQRVWQERFPQRASCAVLVERASGEVRPGRAEQAVLLALLDLLVQWAEAQPLHSTKSVLVLLARPVRGAVGGVVAEADLALWADLEMLQRQVRAGAVATQELPVRTEAPPLLCLPSALQVAADLVVAAAVAEVYCSLPELRVETAPLELPAGMAF